MRQDSTNAVTGKFENVANIIDHRFQFRKGKSKF